MIANIPYLDLMDNSLVYSPIVNEYTIDNTNKKENLDNSVSFLNVCDNIYYLISTEEVINSERNLSNRINDITRIQSFMQKAPSVFAFSSEQFVLSAFEEMRNGLMQLSLDLLSSDISEEEECFFMYGQKKDVKIFFNLFFEENDVEALVNISTPNGKYSIEDSIENSIQRLFKIFQAEGLYGNLS
jgi:hypothetical protein